MAFLKILRKSLENFLKICSKSNFNETIFFLTIKHNKLTFYKYYTFFYISISLYKYILHLNFLCFYVIVGFIRHRKKCRKVFLKKTFFFIN